MISAMIVILVSWYLNAAMDSIAFGKGNRTLYELWHIIKAASYWPPFCWIMWKSGMSVTMITITIMGMALWTVIYRGLRHMQFHRFDDRLKLAWLCKLWGIKQPETEEPWA